PDYVSVAAGRGSHDRPALPVGIIRLRRGRGRERDRQAGSGQQHSTRFAHRCPSRIEWIAGRHCALMPPFLTTCSHFFVSLTMNAPNSVGDFLMTVAPSVAN